MPNFHFIFSVDLISLIAHLLKSDCGCVLNHNIASLLLSPSSVVRKINT